MCLFQFEPSGCLFGLSTSHKHLQLGVSVFVTCKCWEDLKESHGSPVNGGRRVVGHVINEPDVSLVELQGQRVQVFFVQQDAVVFICGHLEDNREHLVNMDHLHLISQVICDKNHYTDHMRQLWSEV